MRIRSVPEEQDFPTDLGAQRGERRPVHAHDDALTQTHASSNAPSPSQKECKASRSLGLEHTDVHALARSTACASPHPLHASKLKHRAGRGQPGVSYVQTTQTAAVEVNVHGLQR